MPLDWQELGDVNLTPREFTLRNLFTRLDERGDLWGRIWEQACSLDEARDRMESLFSEIVARSDNVGGVDG